MRLVLPLTRTSPHQRSQRAAIDTAFAIVDGPPGGATRVPLERAGEIGIGTSIAIGPGGPALIAHDDLSNLDLEAAHCATAACTGVAVLTTLDSPGDAGEFMSLAFGADGLPIISYSDATNSDLKVATCGTVTCEGLASPVAVESTNSFGLAKAGACRA